MRLFKLHSVFFTIIIAMVALYLVLCVIFSVYFTNSLINNTASQRAQTNRNYLNAVIDSVDYQLMSLHQSLTQLSFSRDIFNFAITHEYTDLNANLAMNNIVFTAGNNLLVNTVIFYVPHFDTVISSTYQSSALEDSPHRDMIMAYQQDGIPMQPVEETGRTSFLFLFNGRVTMTRDFPLMGSKKLATLFYVLDMDELGRRIRRETGEADKIYVLTTDYEPVFPAGKGEVDTALFDKLRSGDEDYIHRDDANIYQETSGISAWRYLYITDNENLRPSITTTMVAFLPILLLVLAAASGTTFFITRKLYQPFMRLFNYIESEKLAPKTLAAPKNEFDYINFTLSEISGRQSELSNMMYSVSHDVMSRFFLDVLSGSQFNYSAVKELFENIKSPFQINSSYAVLVIHCQGDLTLMKDKRMLFLADLKNLMDAFSKEHGVLSHILVIDSRTFAVVLAFDSDVFVISIKKSLFALADTLKEFSKKRSLEADLACGEIYHSVMDVGFSYDEAIRELEKQREKPDEKAIDESEERTEMNFISRSNQIISLVLNGDAEGAIELSSRIIDEISESSSGIGDKGENFRMLINAMADSIAKIDYMGSSSIQNDLFMFSAKEAEINTEELRLRAKSSCTNIILELDKMLKKQQNRFILNAQKYIGEHYSDLNLSLDVVAKATGVTASYLSRLFNVDLGIHFTDYVSRCRVDASLELLEQTTMPINEAAIKSGFYTVQNYIRVFKKLTGKTPGQYRLDREEGFSP
jgi:AraC-like DNA-binding protein